jgi:hypothetical protein
VGAAVRVRDILGQKRSLSTPAGGGARIAALDPLSFDLDSESQSPCWTAASALGRALRGRAGSTVRYRLGMTQLRYPMGASPSGELSVIGE